MNTHTTALPFPIRRAIKYVDWQPSEEYTTKRGKIRTIRTGIPAQAFWGFYKSNRETFEAYRLRPRPNGETTVYKKGKAIRRTLWEIQAWSPEILSNLPA